MTLYKKIIVGFLFLGTVALCLRFIPRKHFLQRTSATLLYPVLVGSNTVSEYVQAIVAEKKSYDELLHDYETIQQAHEVLLEAFIKVRGTLHHQEHSQELIDFQQRYQFDDAIVAKVLTKNFSEQEHYCFINKGSQENVRENMVAFYKLQIIGKVSEVHDFYSKITFITDKRCKVACFTNDTHAQGILAGTNKPNQCTLDYVSHLSPVEDQDLLFSSGEGLVFPEGFCLGKIVSHQLQDKALHYEIAVEPLVNLSELKFCLLANQAHINLF